MLAKYDIEYIHHPEHNKRMDVYRTNDPVAAEDFLMSLLASGARSMTLQRGDIPTGRHAGWYGLRGALIVAIKHEGIELTRSQSDRMLRVAADRLSAHLLESAMHLDSAAVMHRFANAPQTADRRPQTADRRPQTADRRPQTADHRERSLVSAERILLKPHSGGKAS